VNDKQLGIISAMLALLTTVIGYIFNRNQRKADVAAKNAETIRAETDAHIALEQHGDESLRQVLDIQRQQIRLLSEQQLNTMNQLNDLETRRALERDKYEAQFQTMRLEHRLERNKWQETHEEMRRLMLQMMRNNETIISGIRILLGQLAQEGITPAFTLTEEFERSNFCLSEMLLEKDIPGHLDGHTRLEEHGEVAVGDEV